MFEKERKIVAEKIVLCKDRGFSNLRGLASEILLQMKREFGKDNVL